MATHNITDGTGGLDASIRLAEEQARPESRTLWPSELLLPLKIGTHSVEFNTLFFPDIVDELEGPSDTDDVAHFDATFVRFDNNNPLVVGFNDTTNSDKRIFSSDGNVTIASFAKSLELYTSTYAELFARMPDTVPSSVHLTDVITPLPVKPNNVQPILVNDTIQFSGEVQFWNMTRDDTRTVNLLWHIGGTHNVCLGFAGTSTSTAGKYSVAWYVFNASQKIPFLSLNPAAGITNMRFVVDGRLDDQGGVGFAVQDSFMFSDTSCGTMIDPNFGFATAAQVRNGVKPTRLYLEALNRDNV
ncbi:hypothetical protein B0H11DRAFT_1918769 [Mycena galericulata]|nr:hypothetical protein B0H11DRAFT_1918769 [Mycena galericulata]